MKSINTVTGTMTAEQLGTTLMHEHLLIGWAGWELDCAAPKFERRAAFKNAVDRLNRVDEAITVATLSAFKPVVAGEMIATVKIIPFAVAAAARDNALSAAQKDTSILYATKPFPGFHELNFLLKSVVLFSETLKFGFPCPCTSCVSISDGGGW